MLAEDEGGKWFFASPLTAANDHHAFQNYCESSTNKMTVDDNLSIVSFHLASDTKEFNPIAGESGTADVLDIPSRCSIVNLSI